MFARRRLTTNIRKLLNQYHFNLLKDMARLLRIATPSTKKGHVEALTPFLFTPEVVKKGLSLLSKREKKVLAAIQRSGGEISAGRLRQQLLRQHVIKPDSRKRYSYSGIHVWGPEQYRINFYTVIGRLIAVGLVCGKGITQVGYSQRTKIYYDNAQTIYVPKEIRHLLPEPPPLIERVFKAENLTRVEESSARAFQRDIYLYWSTVRASPLSLTQSNQPAGNRLYKKDLKRVNESLLVQEDISAKNELDIPRLTFLRRLLTDVGILIQKGRTIQAVDHPKFLGQNPTVRIQRVFKHWRDGAFWNEILGIPGVTISGTKTRADNAPSRIVEARKCVLKHIAALHKESWIPIEHLIDSLRMADYDFLLPRDFRPKRSTFYYYYGYTDRTPYSAYGNEMGWSFSPSFSEEAEGWEVVEAGFIHAIFLEPLYWMGLVDLGYDDRLTDDGAQVREAEAYRLTPIGAWAMGVGGEVDIPGEDGDQVRNVIVQPNYEIFAMDPISDLALAKLDEFADRISAERAMKYTLTRESVYRAQRNKWTSARIIDTLQKMSDKPLPQNVVRTLEEWQLLHERITIHRKANLLHAVDARLLDQLMENPTVRSHLATRPGESVAIVTPEPNETQALVRVLQEMGHLPARTGSPDTLRPSFTLQTASAQTRPPSDDADKRICLLFREALPSIYLFEQIAPFAEQDEQGRCFLTEPAVKNALKHNMTVNDILSRLQALHVGPLPRWAEVKVRAWGNYYGNAAIKALTLVQFRDKDTLLELLCEPELEDILQPFEPDKKKSLALVSIKDLESLREALAKRGIKIENQLE